MTFSIWHVLFLLVYCCIQGVLALSWPLRSGCRVFAFHSVLSFKLDLVWLFFAVISVWPKSMWMSLLDFHLYFCCTEMSVFCYESCQCNPNHGFWTLLIQKFLLTKCLLWGFYWVSMFHHSGIFTKFLYCWIQVGWFPVNYWKVWIAFLGLFYLRVLVNCIMIQIRVPSGLTVAVVFFKRICSFASVVMITVHGVHSAHFNWHVVIDAAFYSYLHIAV